MKNLSTSRRTVLRSLALGLTACVSKRLHADPGTPLARTSAGLLQGLFAREVYQFRGIPYGADTATARFQAPRPPRPWSGLRDALQFGPRAPQLASHGAPERQTGFYLPPETGSFSEDCLHLNIWTAGLRDHRRRPVLVYIHGGGYSGWSSNTDLYDGVELARRGEAVVITLNHRLNLFGYLHLAGLAAGFEDASNAGMLDLVLALQWIRDNIEEFGGDPRRVLLFGQSGGGAKCATLMAMPAAHGLFHRVLTMSGQQVTASRPETATARAQALLDALHLPASRSNDLRTLPMEQLVEASRKAGSWAPVHDGRTLPRDPFAPDAPPLSATVPVIFGNTHDETRFFYPQAVDDATLDWQSLPGRLDPIAQFLGPYSRAQVVDFYRKLYPAYSPADVFYAATTAFRSWRSQLIEAERRAAQPAAQPHTWVYQLNWASPVDGGKWRAPHTLDIPLWFNNTAFAPGMSGDGSAARQMAATMSQTLLAFAQTGNPNHPELPAWHAYNLQSRSTMCFDLPSKLVSDPRGEERRFIEQAPYTQPGT